MPNDARERGRGRGGPPVTPIRITAVVVPLVAVIAGLAGILGGGLSWPGSQASSAAPVATTPGASAPPAGSPAPSPTRLPTPAPTPSPSPTPSPIPSADLQATLDRLRARLSIPGVSVAMLWDDGRSWTGASGMADVAGKVPMTPDRGFALASISKTFTAAVVLELVGEGRLGLDEPVAPLLPAFKLDRRITVRMLLDHTSGLPDFFLNPAINAPLLASPNSTWTAARTWRYVTGKRPVPGTAWGYSNSNYLLLGELVTAVTGRPLATEVRTRLLDPLGLASTWYQVAEPPVAPLTVPYRLVRTGSGTYRAVRVGAGGQVMPFRSVVTAAAGAGSVAATAIDTARWMQAFAGGRVLTPAMQRAMLADAAFTAALKARIVYGLGLQVVLVDGRQALGHSGRYLGYRDVVRYLPYDGVTIAVLTNQNLVDPTTIASALLNVVLPPLPAPSPSSSPSPSGSPPASPGTSGSALPSTGPTPSVTASAAGG